MEERDRRILAHVGRYRLTLRAALDRLFFEGAATGCANVLRRLLRQHLRAREGLPKRLAYYQLTERAAADVGVPVSRAEPLGAQALREALAILWHCTLADLPPGVSRRARLEVVELERLFEGGVGSGPQPHVLEETDEARSVYRVTVPSAATKTANILRGARHWAVRAEESPAFGPWVRAGKYRYLVLAEPARVTEIRRAAQRAELTRIVHVSPAPGPTNIGRELHERRVSEGS